MNAARSAGPVGLNCDMGEAFGIYTLGRDEDLMGYVTAANVACGFHAGDPSVMAATVAAAARHDVAVGAHPSLPDRQGFGRREMRVEPDELAHLLIYQLGSLSGFLAMEGLRLNHLKVHGALYGMTARDQNLAEVVCDVAEKFEVPLYGMAATMHEQAATARGVPFLAEFFADLEYRADGSLVISRTHERVDPEVAAHRARRAIDDGLVTAVDGTDVAVRADTICVHSDTPGAVAVAAAVAGAVGGS